MKNMIFALVGNQNSGKSTIFNEMTSLNQHVGNFPGVTVETVTGKIKGYSYCSAVDLPGLYSLNTFSKDESVTKEFILNQKPDVLINVVDCTKLKRNLYLTLQLLELNIPMVIALNMVDKFEKNNGKIDILRLEKTLGIPIIPITNANRNEVERLIQKSINIERLNIQINKFSKIKDKYKLIDEIIKEITQNSNTNNVDKKTYLIDKLLTNKIFGIPIFLFIMFTIFYITFNLAGPYLAELINKGIEVISNIIDKILETYNISPIIRILINDGIFAGISGVLSFLPIIVILYFFLSLLEDSGYMTRIAFIIDTPLKRLGLSGRSIVPILLGFGCTLPAVLSTRTIQSEKERKLVLILIPFISCSAKIPIYTIIVTTFFKKYAALAMLIIYCFGIVSGIAAMIISRKKKVVQEDDFFIMELPNYRIPTLKNTWRLMWNKSKEFLNKAFSIIFIASITIWFFKSFDINLNYSREDSSILANLSKKISPIFMPIGLSDWRIITALIAGITAKEAIFSTLSVLGNENLYVFLKTIFTIPSAISFILFTLLYTPCIATISAIKKEFGIKTAIQVIIRQFVIAYITAFVSYRILL